MSESISISQDACPRFLRISRSHATPHRHLGADAVVEGARKTAAAPFDSGKDTISSLRAQRLEAVFEEALVIHAELVAVTRPAGERWFADPGRLW